VLSDVKWSRHTVFCKIVPGSKSDGLALGDARCLARRSAPITLGDVGVCGLFGGCFTRLRIMCFGYELVRGLFLSCSL